LPYYAGNSCFLSKVILQAADEVYRAELSLRFNANAIGRISMLTAAVSSSSIFQELQSFYQTRQADVQQLGSSLKSGDLTGAQKAYTALAVLGENGPFGNSEPFSKSSRAQAFNAVGEALQAGDLTRAQTAFATLTGNQSNASAEAQATPAAIVTLSNQSAQANTATATSGASSIYQQLQAFRQQRQADVAQLGQDLQAGNATAAQQDFNTLTALGQTGPNRDAGPFQQAARAQDFQTIGTALQSGNLAAAQTAFANLEAANGTNSVVPEPVVPPVVPAVVPAIVPQPATQTPPVEEIVINLGAPSSANASSPSSSPSTSPPNGSTVPEIVINLNQGSSSASGTAGSGTTGISEIDINFGGPSANSASSTSTAATTPELVINLGQANGSSSANPEELTINLGSGGSGAQVTIGANPAQNGSTAAQVTLNLQPQTNYELLINLLNSTATNQTQSTSSNALSVSA